MHSAAGLPTVRCPARHRLRCRGPRLAPGTVRPEALRHPGSRPHEARPRLRRAGSGDGRGGPLTRIGRPRVPPLSSPRLAARPGQHAPADRRFADQTCIKVTDQPACLYEAASQQGRRSPGLMTSGHLRAREVSHIGYRGQK